ncbi:hypothetical protein BH24ACT12_BH24ACT12_17830 [soil metagenome]|jgi:hypothetical protein
MIALELAQRLRDAGLPWSPAAGDRFVVPDRDLDDEVFVVSDMVVEVHQRPSGQVLGFNGTTEWALDSIETDTVVWLPREQQLRVLLGRLFRALEAQPHGFVVVIERDGAEQQFVDVDAEQAYARALLAVLES